MRVGDSRPRTWERAGALAAEFGLSSLAPLVAACRETEGRGLDVAVVGRFKAGKSSLLNDLARRAVLPVGALPVTSVVVRLRYGLAERAVVRLLDGTSREIPIGELASYVSEHGNPRNAKRVSEVEVGLPSLAPLAPLTLVDTPGLGSALAHNDEATMRWLPRVGTALVAISCDAPLSEQDLALLDELRRHTPRIDLLLTKADILDDTQRAEVREFVSEELRRRWGAPPAVWLYSVKPAFRDAREALERGLLRPLARDHEAAAAEIARHKTSAVVERALDGLRVASAAAEAEQSSREALRRALAEERSKFGLLREELRAPSRGWEARAFESARLVLEPSRRPLQDEVCAAFRADSARWPRRMPALLASWREWLQVELSLRLTETSRTSAAAFTAPLREGEESMRRSLRALRHRLGERVHEALGLALPERDFSLEPPAVPLPSIRVAYADATFELFSPLIPLRLARPAVERWMLARTRWEVEKNLSRLASTWADAITWNLRELTRQAEALALAELSLLEQTLASSPSDALRLRAAISELERLRAGS